MSSALQRRRDNMDCTADIEMLLGHHHVSTPLPNGLTLLLCVPSITPPRDEVNFVAQGTRLGRPRKRRWRKLDFIGQVLPKLTHVHNAQQLLPRQSTRCISLQTSFMRKPCDTITFEEDSAIGPWSAVYGTHVAARLWDQEFWLEIIRETKLWWVGRTGQNGWTGWLRLAIHHVRARLSALVCATQIPYYALPVRSCIRA